MPNAADIGDDGSSAGAARRSSRLPTALSALFLLQWLALAIAPRDRSDWALENALVVAAVPLLLWIHRHVRLSNGSWVALFVLLSLHEIGAHYTYSDVPYDRALRAVFGISLQDALGLSRNHYDRLVHFLYGALTMPATIELLDARCAPRGAWRWLLPVALAMAQSSLYEILEWAAAVVFGGDLGIAYLGTQGDPWDAQADMGLAMAGSLLAVAWLSRRAGHRRK